MPPAKNQKRTWSLDQPTPTHRSKHIHTVYPAPLGVSSYNPTYYPSSPLTGTITLSPSPFTNTSVTGGIGNVNVILTLYARAKVKVVKSDGQSRSEYRSRANFFRVEKKLLHDEGFEGEGMGDGSGALISLLLRELMGDI